MDRRRCAAGTCLLAGGLLAAGLLGRAGSAETDGPAIGFTAAQMGSPLQGRFDQFTARVRFDPQQPQAGSVQARIALASVNAGARAANDLLLSAGFFDAAHFPQADFSATDFAPQADGSYLARGRFTLKGHTEVLPLRFTATAAPDGWWFDGACTVSRLAYGVGQGEWADTGTLDDAVEVRFHVRADPAR